MNLYLVIVIIALAGLVPWSLALVERGLQGRRSARFERHNNSREREIDAQLYELLKNEDPAWLAYMGIEPPRWERISEENYRLWKGEPAPKVGPGEVHIVNHPEHPVVLVNKHPPLSVGQPQAVPYYMRLQDPEVEKKLNERLKFAPGIQELEKSYQLLRQDAPKSN